MDGAQGALSQPEWLRGRDQTIESLPRDVGIINDVERLIRKSRSREA